VIQRREPALLPLYHPNLPPESPYGTPPKVLGLSDFPEEGSGNEACPVVLLVRAWKAGEPSWPASRRDVSSSFTCGVILTHTLAPLVVSNATMRASPLPSAGLSPLVSKAPAGRS